MSESLHHNHTHNSDHGHSHDHGHHDHAHIHDVRAMSRRRLWIALIINAVFLLFEVVGGILTNSLALLADAGHMLTDVAALLLAVFVSTLAEKPATPKRTYGLLRAEVLGALANGAALVIIVGMILWEAWRRIGISQEIHATGMLVIAVLGLLANAGSAWVLFGSRNVTVNLRGAFLHMIADALGSVGAIAAGVVILFTGWTPVDLVASLVISVFILWGSWDLISETVNILLEATPKDIDFYEVQKALLEIDHIQDVHDLHIWTIASGIPSMSAHIRLSSECSDTNHWQECLYTTQKMIRERFGIVHSTFQFEPEDFKRDGRKI